MLLTFPVQTPSSSRCLPSKHWIIKLLPEKSSDNPIEKPCGFTSCFCAKATDDTNVAVVAIAISFVQVVTLASLPMFRSGGCECRRYRREYSSKIVSGCSPSSLHRAARRAKRESIFRQTLLLVIRLCSSKTRLSRCSIASFVMPILLPITNAIVSKILAVGAILDVASSFIAGEAQAINT